MYYTDHEITTLVISNKVIAVSPLIGKTRTRVEYINRDEFAVRVLFNGTVYEIIGDIFDITFKPILRLI